jgi:flagellar motility protein MotE (MotC chaperone)
MKAKIVYGLVFGLAFVLVTFGIIYMNSNYNNIWKFDFSPPAPKQAKAEPVQQQTPPTEENTAQTEVVPPSVDPVQTETAADNKVEPPVSVPKADNSQKDSLKILRDKIAQLEKQLQAKDQKNIVKPNPTPAAQTAKVEEPPKQVINKKKLEEWAKQTAKLYESMDPKKAAKIIQSYSDNESREVLFQMNKKKAAKILAELDTETATRITKAL